MTKKDEIQKYSVFQNIRYCLVNVWQWDKTFYLGFIPRIFLSVALPLAAIYFPRLLIDNITSHPAGTLNHPAGMLNQSAWLDLIILIAVFCVLFALFDWISVVSETKVNSMQGIFQIRYNDICDEKYRLTDYQNTENVQINDLYNNAKHRTYDAENIVKTLNDFFINSLGIVSFGAIIIILDPIILLLIIAGALINFFLLRVVRKYIENNRKNWQEADRRNGYLFSLNYSFEKIKDIKLYPYIGLINSTMAKCQKERLYWHRKVINKETLPPLADVLMTIIRNGVVYFILLSQLLRGDIDAGMFIFFFGAVTGFSGWLNSISWQVGDILTMSMNINFIRSFLETKDIFYRGETKISLNEATYDIELENLRFTYPGCDNETISGIDFKINKGEKIALVGANGAGKTTLVKLICGLYYPTSGDVKINGASIREININDYYDLFSVVFQEHRTLPITIAKFISGTGVDINREKVRECLELAGLMERVEKCPKGIDTSFLVDFYGDDPGLELSGGEVQKLLLARALYKDAPILILDEPTAALDPIAESEMYQRFNEFSKDKTSIYISHRLASTRFCDRIILIDNGVITECGTHDELMEKQGKYYEMFEAQSHYYK